MDSNDSMSVVSEDTANSLQDNLQNLNMIEAKDDCDDAMMTSDDDYQQMSLDTLPAELLLHILQYLEVKFSPINHPWNPHCIELSSKLGFRNYSIICYAL